LTNRHRPPPLVLSEVALCPADAWKISPAPSLLHANDGDLGPFPRNQYILHDGLIKEIIFVKFEVINRCSDVQKLFSVVSEGRSNIMYKIRYKQHENSTVD
jgi:hypothetical protein